MVERKERRRWEENEEGDEKKTWEKEEEDEVFGMCVVVGMGGP